MRDVQPGGVIAFQSDRVEELVDRLVVELVAEQKRTARAVHRRPFVDHLVVIPTRNLETYLNFEIAARRGVSAGLRYITIQRFLEELLPEKELGQSGIHLLDHRGITRLVLAAFEDPRIFKQPELEAVRRFVFPFENATSEMVERRKFQLATRVAHLFEEYGYSRQNLLRCWRKGQLAIEREYPRRTTEAQLEIEQWQMALWRAIFGPDGLVRHSPGDEDRHWMTLPEAIIHFAGHDELELRWPEAVHFFGHSYLPRFFRDLLSKRTLAEDRRICLYVMTPSLESWSDGVAGDRDEDPVFEILADDSPFEGDEYPLALEVWGRAGRDYQRMIDFVAYDRDDVSLVEERSCHTLLQHFQAMIREMRTARTLFVDSELPKDDKSFNFWSCASVQRECEAVASEIWEIVTTHEELRFNDIAVVVQPGDRSLYQTHLEAAFEQTGGIPCNIIDVESGQANPFMEVAGLLLGLPLGEFRRSELLALLIHPCLVARYPEADEDAWLQWCQEVNIYQGAGDDDLEDTYLESDRFTWGQGIKRLVLGAFMSQPDERRPQAISLGGLEYLPHETNHGDQEALAALTVVVDELIDWARRVRRSRRPLGEWMELFAEVIGDHLRARDRREERCRMRFLGSLGDIADGDPRPEDPVSYRVAYDFARTAMSEMEDSRGQYLADGVVVSAFKPMRPIPFEVVFVTGLGEGKFPAPNPPDMLDLRRVKSEAHDVNPRYRDQYMFLETLVSTRSRLYLSWVGRHAVTGDSLEPASVVHQLREMILEMTPRDESAERVREYLKQRVAIDEHPLRRWDDRYFPAWSNEEKSEEIDASAADAIPPRDEEEKRESCAEKLWPNHHRQARREARVRAIRRDLERRLPRGFEPSMHQLRSALGDGAFMPLAEMVGWLSPTEGKRRRQWDRLVLHISQLEKFLRCPLQGSARVVLSLFSEDMEEALQVDYEPFQAEFLTRLGLVRRALEEALHAGEFDDRGLARAFDDRARIAELAGDVPAGIFFEAEREKCLNMLQRYADALRSGGFGDARLERLRLGTVAEGQKADRLVDPLVLDVEIGGVERAVEIHGTVDLLATDKLRTLVVAAGKKPGVKHAVSGGLKQIVLQAAGVEGLVGSTVISLNGKSKNFEASRIEGEAAREYLTELTTDLLTGVHDYFLPVEIVAELASGGVDDLRRYAEEKKYPSYGSVKVSSKYGPVRRWADADPPSRELADQIVARRYAPFLDDLEGKS